VPACSRLVEPGTELQGGQIYDSNRRVLLALVAEAGATPIDLGRVPDDEAALVDVLSDAVARCDVLISTGGVSMGDFDYVKAVLGRMGDVRWMQVAIKPAKPLSAGTLPAPDGRSVAVYGLPGNPVSAQVSFELFVRPALRQLMGHRHLDRRLLRAVVPDGIRRKRDGKVHFDRVRLDEDAAGTVVAHPLRQQGSHHTAAMAAAAGLAVVPDGTGIEPGGTVEVIPLGVEW
jgi:molybdopterin molybdotransferase